MTETSPTAWFYCYSNGCEGLIEMRSGPLPTGLHSNALVLPAMETAGTAATR